MKGIHHHRQLFGFFCTNTPFYCTRMRAMRYTGRMQGDHAPGYVLTTHKIAIHIIQHFIAVDIAVVIRGRYRLRVIVEQAWTERTYHIVIAFKGLVYRWRLVYPAGYGFKIMYAESERVTTAVPPNNIKRVMAIMQVIHHAPFFGADQKIAFLIESGQV